MHSVLHTRPFCSTYHVLTASARPLRAHSQPRRLLCTRARAGQAQPYAPSSAKDAIEIGLGAFKDRRDYREAQRLFQAALELRPSDDEKREALYNLGCALAKQKKWQEAVDSILSAVNDYGLKLSVPLKDDDLLELRDRREWMDGVTEAKGGLSRSAKVNLRTEAKAPFRLSRIVIFGGLLAGAGLGLVIIALRLVSASRGGEGAPDMTETLQNFAINGAAVAVLSFLVGRDLKARDVELKKTSREESLSRLQLELGPGRVLPLLRFRGQVRPVIVAGTSGFVERSIKEADRLYPDLRERGVSVIPVVVGSSGASNEDPALKLAALKREFSKDRSSARGFGGASTQKADATAPGEADAPAGGQLQQEDRKWRLQPAAPAEWEQWVIEQTEAASLAAGDRNVWVQIQLDGTVRASGVGTPPWARLVEALPPLGSFRTSVTDGIGPSE